MDWRTRKIVAAAITYEGEVYTLPPPMRHHDVMRFMADDFGIAEPGRGEQGFLTDQGEFVRRKPAFMIAEHAGQLIRKQGPGTYQGPELFSEDLW